MTVLLTITVVALMALVGCAKPPTDAINGAKAALEAFIKDGAETYSKAELTKLQGAMTAAMDEVKLQDDKFALFRNYDKVTQMVTQVTNDINAEKAKLPGKKQKAKDEATAALSAAAAAVGEAKTLLENAPKGKGTMADIEAMKGDVAALGEDLGKAQAMIDKGEFLAVPAKVKPIQDKAMDISAQVKAAMEKVQKVQAPAKKK
jgi:hypothetical protein